MKINKRKTANKVIPRPTIALSELQRIKEDISRPV